MQFIDALTHLEEFLKNYKSTELFLNDLSSRLKFAIRLI